MSISLHHVVHVGHPRTKTILTYLEHYTVKTWIFCEKPGLSNEKPEFSIDNPGLSTINRKSRIFKVKNMEYTVQMAFHIRGQWPV